MFPKMVVIAVKTGLEAATQATHPISVRPLVCYVFSGSEAPREWATRLVGAEASLTLFLFRFLFLLVSGCRLSLVDKTAT